MCTFFFFKQKTAYEMRISDWSSDVCSSDLRPLSDDELDDLLSELQKRQKRARAESQFGTADEAVIAADRKSVVEGKSVSVRVDLGGRRILKKKKKQVTVQSKYNQAV